MVYIGRLPYYFYTPLYFLEIFILLYTLVKENEASVLCNIYAISQ